MSEGDACVRVAVRVRPLTAKEQLQNSAECLSLVPGQPELVLNSTRSYRYDHVFGTDAEQDALFDTCARALIQKFIDGYNATILAYGQTGSGKTYTMGTGFDTVRDNERSLGIIPRAIYELFHILNRIKEEKPAFKFSVFVSFLELYNEELIDLLNPNSRNAASRKGFTSTALTIREDSSGGIYWSGVREEPVSSPEELLACLQRGSLCRTTGSTDMNMTSSRSHAIFSVVLKQEKPQLNESNLQNEQKEVVVQKLASKFHFVDLAGSERMKKTNALGERAKEGIAINSGLLAMGKVIHALNEGASHVPYRDSKLTRLLQDSLGGNSQTLMIACVSPADVNFGETLNTLNYASRARNIKNKAVVNQDYQAMEVHQLRAEVARLKMQLMETRGSSGSAPGGAEDAVQIFRYQKENESLKAECQKLETQLIQIQQRQSQLREKLVQVETERDSLLFTEKVGNNVTDVNSPVVQTHPIIESYQKKINDLETKLAKTQDELAVVKASQPSISASYDSIHTSTASLRLSRPPSAVGTVPGNRISQTIEKAKQEIRKEIRLVQERRRRGKRRKSSGVSDNENDGSQDEYEDVDDEPVIASQESLDAAEDDGDPMSENVQSPTSTEDEMLEMLDQIQNDITIKEELVEHLEKTQMDYQFMREKYEEKLQLLHDNLMSVQRERDLALKKGEGTDDKDKTEIIRSRYEEKIKKLMTEISDLKKRYQESRKEINAKRLANENLLKSFRTNIETLKKDKLKMLKQIKEKEIALRETELATQKEITQLRRRERNMAELTQKLERANRMHQLMLKKRTEEHLQTQSKLRSVMQLVKKGRPASSPVIKRFRHRNGRDLESPRRSNSSASFHNVPGSPRQKRGSRQLAVGDIEAHLREEERSRMKTTFKKNLLYKEIDSFIAAKHITEIADELLRKREVLSQEKRDLMNERKQHSQDIQKLETNSSKQPATIVQDKVLFLHQQIQEIDNRIEIIDAEIKYLSARAKSIQAEAAQTQDGSSPGVSPTSDVAASYENALDIIKTMDPKEREQMLELMLEDFIEVRLTERSKQMEIQELTKQLDASRHTIQVMRKTAVETNFDNERRISEYEHQLSSIRKGKLPPRELGRDGSRKSIMADVTNFNQDFDEIDAALGTVTVSEKSKISSSTWSSTESLKPHNRAWSTNSAPRPSDDKSGGSPTQPISTFAQMSSSSASHLNRKQGAPTVMGITSTSPTTVLPPIDKMGSKDKLTAGSNVFERLHREQTIASQAKVRDMMNSQYSSNSSLSNVSTALPLTGQVRPSRSSFGQSDVSSPMISPSIISSPGVDGIGKSDHQPDAESVIVEAPPELKMLETKKILPPLPSASENAPTSSAQMGTLMSIKDAIQNALSSGRNRSKQSIDKIDVTTSLSGDSASSSQYSPRKNNAEAG